MRASIPSRRGHRRTLTASRRDHVPPHRPPDARQCDAGASRGAPDGVPLTELPFDQKDTLSEALLRGEFEPADTIRVDVVQEQNDEGREEEKLNYTRVPAPVPEESAEEPAVATS